jgi:hypothetical protein
MVPRKELEALSKLVMKVVPGALKKSGTVNCQSVVPKEVE